MTVLLQIFLYKIMFSWFRQWNKFENRSVFEKVKAYEVKAYKKCASFLGGHPVGLLFSEAAWVQTDCGSGDTGADRRSRLTIPATVVRRRFSGFHLGKRSRSQSTGDDPVGKRADYRTEPAVIALAFCTAQKLYSCRRAQRSRRYCSRFHHHQSCAAAEV